MLGGKGRVDQGKGWKNQEGGVRELCLQTLGGAVAQFGRLRLERGLSFFIQSVLGSLKEF